MIYKGGNVKYFKLSSVVYTLFLRKLLKEVVDDPKTEWDNYLIDSLDTIFNHKK